MVCKDESEELFTPAQLLWVNLIMDAFASLALATDCPDKHVLDRKPESRDAPLISLTSLKMIILQAIYQAIVTLYLWPAAEESKTRVFNTFIWMSWFNLLK